MSHVAGRNVVDAVFELREAAIAHGQALEQAERVDDPTVVDALLESQLDLEEKTVAAIEECEGDHAADAGGAPCSATTEALAMQTQPASNVIHVNFTESDRATRAKSPEGA